MGQPIRLFGESDADRMLRLRALQLLKDHQRGNATGGRNDFRRMVEEIARDLMEKQAKGMDEIKVKDMEKAEMDEEVQKRQLRKQVGGFVRFRWA